MNRRIFAVIAAGVALLALQACDPKRQRREDPGGAWTVEARNVPEQACNCPTARRLFLKNRTNELKSITFTEYRSVTLSTDPPTTEPRTFQVEPGGGKFLRCSPETTNVPCDTTYAWEVAGVVYRGESAATGLTAANLKALLSKAKAAPKVVASCHEECLVRDGPYCVSARASHLPNGEVASRILARLHAIKLSGTISTQEMLRLLGQREDPCGRSATVSRDGFLSNSGAACVFSSETGPGNGFDLIVPDSLFGQFGAASAPLFTLSFPDPQSALRVEFEAGDMDDLFGGVVRTIEERRIASGPKQGRWLVVTTNGCLALKL